MKNYIWWFISFWVFLIMSCILWLDYINNIGPYFKNFFAGIEHNLFQEFLSISVLVAILSFCGFNFGLWGIIGIFRLLQEKFSQSTLLTSTNFRKKLSIDFLKTNLSVFDIAVIVPAHNEELVIAKTINSLLSLISPVNIFVVSDGSVDKTAELARNFKVNVLELNKAHGKAGALKAGIERYALDKRFKIVLFVDADTVLPADYIAKALPFFNDPEVVAIAGYARTIWDPSHQSLSQSYFIAHRELVYTLSQLLLKFGQSWRYANVATIIPGFASMYRSSILEKIDLNPPGLVIEDFNMTFEVHHKRLGRIVHHPQVSGYTQDPDNFKDYFRQIKRWDLGFLQTLKLHGFWPSKFSVTLLLYVGEVILSSLILIAAPLFLVVLPVLALIPSLQAEVISLLFLVIKIILFGLWLPNIIISFIVGLIKKRPQYFYFSPFFIFMKFIDSVAFLYMLPKAFLTNSSGHWTSPNRRVE